MITPYNCYTPRVAKYYFKPNQPYKFVLTYLNVVKIRETNYSFSY